MRFGLFIPQGWRQDLTGIDPSRHWATMHALARRADTAVAGEAVPGARFAWESIWVYDHFHAVPEPNGEATHEAWSLMAAFAASTERVRLGQMCTCMGYRNPAYLAKVAATVDVVAGGRLELGIGAGWYEHEWRAYGYGFPSARERLDMLEEGVQILRQLWTDGRATFAGNQYRVDGAQLAPLPLQAGGPPVWIAGGGEQRTLRIAAQNADYTNFFGPVERFAHKSRVLRQHCAQIGRPFEEITRSTNFNVIIGARAADVDDRFAQLSDHYRRSLTPGGADQAIADLRAEQLTGTPEQVIETLRGLREVGLGYAVCYFPEAAYDRSGIELFEREVIPALTD